MQRQIEERQLDGVNGWLMLAVIIAGAVLGLATAVVGFVMVDTSELFLVLAGLGLVVFGVSMILLPGLDRKSVV